ncbi:carbohydrate ABC transporter permease [Mycoplasmatota bacterium zrk1]
MKKFSRLFIYIIMLIFAVTTILPFAYMVATALTPDTYTMPYPPIIIPKKFYIGNFIAAFKSNNFGRYFLNSLFVSVTSTICAITVSSLTAYSFARFTFRGKELIFKVFLFSMMVPGLVNIVPQFLVLKTLDLIDTYFGLILLYIGGGIAGSTFFLRGFFESIPKELEESVVIDGGTRWTVFRHIILPLSKPALATFSIFAFTGFWDEFLQALTVIKSVDKRTLPIAIQLFRGQHGSDWGLIFAASLISIIPIITIFILFQKRFIKGDFLSGSSKG